jgi:NADPH:quinone reductase-like Zn-dependent oxidoreductase
MLEMLGAERCEIERRDLSKHIAEVKQIDAVLDLVGNSVVLDSLAMLRRGGRSCLAGWLGGLDPIPDLVLAPGCPCKRGCRAHRIFRERWYA